MPNKEIADVTINICAHNNEKTIERAVDSVVSQSFTDWKLHIIVSKSNDKTLEKCRNYSDARIIVVEKSTQQSWAKSSIEGIENANTKYFMWLDGDDFIERNWLSVVVDHLKKNDFNAAIGGIKLSNDGGETFIKNISNCANYGFAKSRSSCFRVASYLFLPESYGAVNMLYSVWNTDFLKQAITWKDSDVSLDFDTKFILNVLSRSKIYTSRETYLVRENRGYNHDLKLDTDPEMLNKNIWMMIKILIWQMLITKPRTRLYFNWARTNHGFLPLVLPILLIRECVSIFSPILISIKLKLEKLRIFTK